MINKGDFVFFIGFLGCGKIMFLWCIVVFEILMGGMLLVNGMMFDEVCCVWVYGYVFQVVGLYLWWIIGGNIWLLFEIMGFDKVEQVERVVKVLDFVELLGFEKKFLWQLLGGMQQCVLIVCVLVFDVDILLMDEFFGVFDEIVWDCLNEELFKFWGCIGKIIGFVIYFIFEVVYLFIKIVVMFLWLGWIIDVIDSFLLKEWLLDICDSVEFIEIVYCVCEGLCVGYVED